MLRSFTPTYSLRPYEYGEGSMYRSFFGDDSLPEEDCFRINSYVNDTQYMPGYIRLRDAFPSHSGTPCHFTREDAENTTSKYQFRPTVMTLDGFDISALRKYLLREHSTFLGVPDYRNKHNDEGYSVKRNLIVVGHNLTDPDDEWTLEGKTGRTQHGRECCGSDASDALLHIYIDISDRYVDEIIENIGSEYGGVVYESYYSVLDEEKQELLQIIEELKNNQQ